MSATDSEGKRGGPYDIDRDLWFPMSDFLGVMEQAGGYKEYQNAYFVFRPYFEVVPAVPEEPWHNFIPETRPNFEVLSQESDFFGLTIAWYKHPLRGANCNRELPLDDIRTLFKECIESLIEETLGLHRMGYFNKVTGD